MPLIGVGIEPFPAVAENDVAIPPSSVTPVDREVGPARGDGKIIGRRRHDARLYILIDEHDGTAPRR
jgi:hypothetical protein